MLLLERQVVLLRVLAGGACAFRKSGLYMFYCRKLFLFVHGILFSWDRPCDCWSINLPPFLVLLLLLLAVDPCHDDSYTHLYCSDDCWSVDLPPFLVPLMMTLTLAQRSSNWGAGPPRGALIDPRGGARLWPREASC